MDYFYYKNKVTGHIASLSIGEATMNFHIDRTNITKKFFLSTDKKRRSQHLKKHPEEILKKCVDNVDDWKQVDVMDCFQ